MFGLREFDAPFDTVKNPTQQFLAHCPETISLEQLFKWYGVLFTASGDAQGWEYRVYGM